MPKQPITAEILRERCSRLLLQNTGLRDDETSRRAIPSAVLVPIVRHPERLTVLLTKRADNLRDHAGQISFPGGRREAADDSAIATALRESSEEIGINTRRIEVLGVLPDYLTVTGFCITPVVGLTTLPLELAVDSREVAQVIEAPLDFCLADGNYCQTEYLYQGERRYYWSMTWDSHHVWGATAGILTSLRKLLWPELA